MEGRSGHVDEVGKAARHGDTDEAAVLAVLGVAAATEFAGATNQPGLYDIEAVGQGLRGFDNRTGKFMTRYCAWSAAGGVAETVEVGAANTTGRDLQSHPAGR